MQMSTVRGNSQWFCSSFAFCEELDLPEKSVKCQSDICVSLLCSVLSEELLSCSNASFMSFPLTIKVRGHKVLNQMTGKFGTIESNTLLQFHMLKDLFTFLSKDAFL